jgi:hypothetical protein
VTDTGGISDRALYLQSTTTADYAPNINAFIAQHCGIIVTTGFLMADATEAAAKAHPKQHFAIVDCSYRTDCLQGKKLPNIDQLPLRLSPWCWPLLMAITSRPTPATWPTAESRSRRTTTSPT